MAGRLWRSDADSNGHLAAEETRKSSPAEKAPKAEDFERIMIRNIATVPFEESFYLLRSAPVEMRSRWTKQLEEMPKGPQRNAALSSFYKTFVQLDPHAAAASMAGLQDKDAKSIAVAAMIGATPQSAMKEMAEMLVKLPDDIPGGQNLLGEIIFNWSAVDPIAAAQFIEEHRDVSSNCADSVSLSISILLSNWVQVDPEAAKAWLERQDESDQTEDEINSLLTGWAEHDRTKALAFAEAHAGEKKFGRAVTNLTWGLFLSSPDEARTFLFRLPSEARNDAIDEIATLTNGNILGGSESWRRPPEDIARWILTLPQDSWKGAIGTVLENWNKENAAELSAWLNQLPPDTRDPVVADYCSSENNRVHPDKAVSLALTIADPALRSQTLDNYMCRWLPSSPEQAVVVIKESVLSDAQKQYLIKRLPHE